MFDPRDLRRRLRRQPFLPLRLTVASGQSYVIRHPDLAWLTARSVFVGVPAEGDETLPDQITEISLFHLSEIQDLPAPVPTSGNGEA
jgi:hypothetical protein